MKTNLLRRNACRLCEGDSFELVLPIKPSPIADAYVPAARLSEVQECYPLDLYLCLDCGHLQHLDVVNPEILFRDYNYVTSSSLGLVDHFRKYADEIVERLSLRPGSLVVEVGSNDGSLLRFFNAKGLRVLGVDPAKKIAEGAAKSGIPTIAEFFTSSLSEKIAKEYGPASLVSANNVFAHADNLHDIVRGIRCLLADDGVFVFEVSYLVDIVDRFLFDTVYHEHVSYHSIAPLGKFFRRLGMDLFDVKRIEAKGGSIRGFAQKIPGGKRDTQPLVTQLLQLEKQRGMSRPDVFRKFNDDIEAKKAELNKYLDHLIASGKTIAGYGASTTVTTLIYHFELGKKIGFLLDDNPRKHYLYSPGLHIPVLPSEELYTRKPDYVVILAWQYTEPIIKKHQRFLDNGGQFIIPLPAVRVVQNLQA